MEKTVNQEEQIFLAALELTSAEDRRELLIQRCGNDQQLLKRVEELLAIHERGDNILDDTSNGFLQQDLAATDSIKVGTQIGPYKLLQEIGYGGMGVVYMAEQLQPVKRRVAIKIIKLGMDTRNVIARFEAERQALAMMDHPNITKVFDAGCTPTGRPYFVMELVTGLAITEYCDREKLSLRERIELFHQVCVGVKHAHQKGVIHRDLKPSNVMVTHYDGVPVPKIIDFGIAKAIDQTLTEKTLFTSYGNMIGTPEYMSPEQAEMSGQDIDTRADVYSLGALMYELLTGTTPFYQWKKKGIHKFCEAICTEEPELASTRVNNLADTVKEISGNRNTDARSLKRILRGDMDWILSKCMSKNRSHRYETAADLARDVQRYLDGQPVEAVGPNMGYRVSKFARKHRTSLSFAAVIFLTLVSATIVSMVFAFQANSAKKLANNRLHEVDQLRREAELERDRALAAERKLQQMERRSRGEAATARAVAEFSRRYPNQMVRVHYPDHRATRGTMRLSSLPGTVIDRSENVLVFEPGEEPNGTDLNVVEIENNHVGSPAKHADEHRMHTFRVMIGDEGDLEVTAAGPESIKAINEHEHDVAKQIVVIRDKDGAVETKKFLNLLVDEQRELFGPDDDVVANTLIEIGNMSLQEKDWSIAENHFREGRDILELQVGDDARKAKVELLLSKALLHQQKHAAAKQTLAKSVDHLVRLRKVPEDLKIVMEELSEMEITDEEIHELFPHDLKIRIKEKFNTELKTETHKK